MKTVSRLGFVLFSLLLWTWVAPTSAHAAGVVGTGTPASCTGNALQTRITGGGLVTFDCGPNPHTIIANTYVIDQNTTIDGGGRITLDGELARQLFIVDPGVVLTLRNIVLLQGRAPDGGCIYVHGGGSAVTNQVFFDRCDAETGRGGAVYNLGTFNADFTLFGGNTARLQGGAIFSFGDLSVRDSEFSLNGTSNGGGGAISVSRLVGSDHSAVILRSLFLSNQATTFGGAINNVSGEVDITNSTFSNNRADQGGAIFGDGGTQTVIYFSTIYQNRADLGGGLFRSGTGVINFGATIVADSRFTDGSTGQLNCDSGGGSYASLGYNIVDDNSCFSPAVTDQIPTNPQLGNLLNNGGGTFTHLPNSGSPALDKVPKAQCPAYDQRRAFRLSSTCDIGAAERGGALPQVYLPTLRR